MSAKLLALLSLLVAATGPGFGQSSPDQVLSHRIIPGWTQGDGTRIAGLELSLAPGWKTYWRSPGDAGIPPEFDWRGAGNLDRVHVHWPAPVVFWQSGMRSVGYKDRVVLPLSIVPQSPGGDIHLKGRVDLGICSDICIPASIDIDAMLPNQSDRRSPAIVAALAARPLSAEEAGLTVATCRLAPTETGLMVEAQLTMPSSGGREQAVIEAPAPDIWVSEAQADRRGDWLTVSAEMVAHASGPLVVDRSRLRITVIGEDYAVDIRGCTG